MGILILSIVTVLFFSFVFSCTEAAFLSLPAGEKLSESSEKVKSAFKSTLCTLVLGNNIGNIAGSAALGQIASRELPEWAQTPFVVLLVVLVIIFGESIPKALGEAKSVQIVKFMSPTLLVLGWLFTPAINVMEWFLKFLPKKEVVEAEEELVEAARSLDTTPVSELPLVEGEEMTAKVVHDTMADEAIKILLSEGNVSVYNERLVFMGNLTKEVALKHLFDHYPT